MRQEVNRPAGDHRHQGEACGQARQELRRAGERTGPHRIRHYRRQRAVEIEAERALSRVSNERQEDLGKCAHRPGRDQAPATRSAPATTTTSSPVMPVTGTAAVNGSTAAGLRPSVDAMAAAAA